MASNGTLKWSYETGDGVSSSPAIGMDGTVYVGSDDDRLYAIHPDGTKKWAFKLGGIPTSPTIGRDGTIYVGCSDGNLYAINSDCRGLAKTPWPMYGHDARHTCSAQYTESRPAVLGLEDGVQPQRSVTWSWEADEEATFCHAVNQNATWSFAETVPFTKQSNATLSGKDGKWYLHVQAKDTDGELSQVRTVSILLDNTPPQAKVHGVPDSPSYTDNACLTLESADVTRYRYKLDDSAWSDAASVTREIELSGLGQGVHRLAVIGQDRAGNWQSTINATRVSWEVIVVEPGDVSADGSLGLKDAILALKYSCNPFQSGEMHSDSDVDGDGQIGLAEAVYVLQCISQ